MGKFTEFLDKVMADETARAAFEAVIGMRKERELSDDDFQKIVELSEKLGAAVTLDEVKDFFSGNGRELSEEELAGVAGGLASIDKENCVIWKLQCPVCGGQIDCYLPYHDGKLDMYSSKLGAKRGISDHMDEHIMPQPDNVQQFIMCAIDLLKEHESDLAEIVASHS